MSPDRSDSAGRLARTTLKFLLFMVVLVTVVWALRSGLLGADLTPNALRTRVEAAGPLAPFLYFLLYAVLVNLIVPASALVIAASIAFGWKTAFALSIPATILAYLIGYLVSAAVLREPVRRLLDRAGWLPILERLERRSPWRLAFAARFTPIPVGAQNYLLGLSRIPLVPYLVGSIIAQIPWLFAFTTLGATAGLPMRLPFFSGVGIYFVLVIGADWWWTRREQRTGM